MAKLKAATLVESIIAMIVVVVCMGISSMIYINVMQSDKQRLNLKAAFLLNKETIDVKENKKFIDTEINEGSWIIKVAVNPYKEIGNLYQLQLSAVDSRGIVIATRSELIIMEQ